MKKPFKILSLDGGGAWAIIQAAMKKSGRKWRVLLQVVILAGLSLAVTVTAYAEDRSLRRLPTNQAISEKRVALVIGNGDYKGAPLANPVNDARDVAASIARLGFAVTLRENADQKAMRQAIRDFGNELLKGGVGLFYYAGHGMQVKGRNWLIPVGEDIRSEDEVEDQSVDANLVLEKLETAQNRVNIVILDACRNNPFIRSSRSASGGLIPMDAPVGTLVAFSTSPGSVASDGNGRNGLYTQYLLQNLQQPGLKVEDIFKRVRQGVRLATSGKQIPWENTSLEGDFYFTGSVPAAEEISPIQTIATVAIPQIPNWKLMDREYGEGFREFKFGMTPEQVNALLMKKFGNVSWNSLPVAGEYKNAEVRYFWLHLPDLSSLPRYGIYSKCVSGSSYLTFMFAKNQLFRLSLRFVDDGGCKDHRAIFDEFRELFGGSGAGGELVVRGEKVVLFAGDYHERHFPWDAGLFGTLVEFEKVGSPRFEGQEW